MENREKVIEAIRAAGAPVSEGDIVKATGLEKKDVTKVFTALKKEGAITSPVRCKWEMAE